MASEKELLRFVLGGENINHDLVLKEINSMVYVSSRRLYRIVDKNDVDEISSLLFTHLWEIRDTFPLTEEDVFSFLKKLIYKECSLTKEINGFDMSFDSVFENKEDSPDDFNTEVEDKEVFLTDFENVYLPKSLKIAYKNIVLETEKGILYAIAETDTFLGHLLLAFLMRGETSQQNFLESKNMFSVAKRTEEVLVACFSLKLMKKWFLPAYVVYGSALFISSISFLGPVLVSPFEKYFKNLFFSVKIFCDAERYDHQYDLEEALRTLSRKYSIRMRDIRRRQDKVKRMLEKYNALSDVYSSTLHSDLLSFLRQDKSQISFDFTSV